VIRGTARTASCLAGALAAVVSGPASAQTRPASADLTALADRARPAVVHVRGTIDERRAGRGGGPPSVSVGSGFLVDSVGFIVTNEHVIRGTNELRVRLYDGREFNACVMGGDALADIALLKIEGQRAFPSLKMANSDKVRAGQTVLAIGSPFGFAHSVTAGIVSATERVVEQGSDTSADERDDPPYAFFIQTDASINVGNSGGPLIDAAGAVIGVNAAFWGGSQPASGVGFAIPINVVRLLLPQLRDRGAAPRSYLGVESQPVTAELAAAFRLRNARGALIAGVEKGSAAEQAGLQVGDVVHSIGKHTLATRDDFRIFAQLTPPGSKMKLGVLRDHKPLEVTVTTRAARNAPPPRHPADCRGLAKLGPRPPDPSGNPMTSLGFEVKELSKDRAAELPGGRGVQVSRVFGGPAREAKLEVGDILLRVGHNIVGGPDDLRRLLAAWKRDVPLPVLVRTRTRTFWSALRGY
jgi:serine protease Do